MNCTYCNHPVHVHDYKDKCNVPGCDCIYSHDSAKLTALEVEIERLRVLCEGHKIIEAHLQSELDKTRDIIQAFSNHDDYIGRKTVMQVADEWLAAHPEEKNNGAHLS